MHLRDDLLLLLHHLLLPLELVLMSLKLCKGGSCLLCLASLILPHPLKYGKKSGICLRCRWSSTRATGLMIMSTCRHLSDITVVLI